VSSVSVSSSSVRSVVDSLILVNSFSKSDNPDLMSAPVLFFIFSTNFFAFLAKFRVRINASFHSFCSCSSFAMRDTLMWCKYNKLSVPAACADLFS